MKRSRRRTSRHGFTLLEVLLVLAILVILGSTVGVFFARTQTTANKKAAMVQINLLEQLMDQYRIDVGTYPADQQGLQALMAAPPELADPTRWAGPYSRKQIPADPWQNEYHYMSTGADTFRIWSFGPDGQDNTGDEVSNIPM